MGPVPPRCRAPSAATAALLEPQLRPTSCITDAVGVQPLAEHQTLHAALRAVASARTQTLYCRALPPLALVVRDAIALTVHPAITWPMPVQLESQEWEL